MRDSSREKKKNRNPSSRKIVGLKGYSSGTNAVLSGGALARRPA